MIGMIEPKICSPKIWRDKTLDYGEKAVAHHLAIPGIYFNLLYIQNDELNIEEFKANFDLKPNQNIYDCHGFSESIMNHIENIKNHLLYDAKFLNCNFKLRITLENTIEILYGVQPGDLFISFEELEYLADDLNIKVVKPTWKGIYSTMVDHVFLENTLIQKY